MNTKRERISIEEPFEDLLGKPALLKSEDSRDYAKLRAAIEREIDPKGIFDTIRVQDLTDKIWERATTEAQSGGADRQCVSAIVGHVVRPSLRRKSRSCV